MKKIFVGMLDDQETSDALQELQLLRELSHQNIIEYKDGFLEESPGHVGHVCIVTEYCEGGDLATHINAVRKRKSAIPKNQIFEWFLQLSRESQYPIILLFELANVISWFEYFLIIMIPYIKLL